MVRIPCEEGGRDWNNTSTSQGMTKMPASPEARAEAWNRFSFKAITRNQPCLLLDFGLLVSRIMK